MAGGFYLQSKITGNLMLKMKGMRAVRTRVSFSAIRPSYALSIYLICSVVLIKNRVIQLIVQLTICLATTTICTKHKTRKAPCA
ncbi:hypothetical protein F4782DRAFT_493365 [Xylaria castorea]|nr:hypothetical protein F4782DRAFT_493365 [Xylaria castorea]